jgi:peptidoglycan/LPS O-acetylase OafA/YrhL
VVVVLHHLLLIISPTLKTQFGDGWASPLWWLNDTPLALVTAGAQSVLVFFVLSGLVVALPGIRSGRVSWAGFLSGRMIRLYVPVWASLAIATALLWLVPRDDPSVSGGSWLGSANATSTSAIELLQQAGLTEPSYDLNNVLWSLRWELLFSVLLPLFVAVALLVRRVWWAAAAVAVLISAAGDLTSNGTLQYLPVFFLGTLVAVRLDGLREWMRRRAARRHARLAAGALVGASVAALVVGPILSPVVGPGSPAAILITDLAVPGAFGLVLAALGVPALRRGLETGAAQWLGRMSFSLYLTHVPLLVTLAFALGTDRWWLIVLLGIPLSLLAAWVFHRVIERPSHRLAQWTSAKVGLQLERVRASRDQGRSAS